MSGWRKAEREFDLGAKVHAMKQHDPDLNLTQIAQRLGYSSSRVSQVYGKWRRQRNIPINDKKNGIFINHIFKEIQIMGKKGMSVDEHALIGMSLFEIQETLTRVVVFVGNAYSLSKLSKVFRHLLKAEKAIQEARSLMENIAINENPQLENKKALGLYYPGNLSRIDDFKNENH